MRRCPVDWPFQVAMVEDAEGQEYFEFAVRIPVENEGSTHRRAAPIVRTKPPATPKAPPLEK